MISVEYGRNLKQKFFTKEKKLWKFLRNFASIFIQNETQVSYPPLQNTKIQLISRSFYRVVFIEGKKVSFLNFTSLTQLIQTDFNLKYLLKVEVKS